jgi:vancomycin resistance protein YoaR
LTVLKTHFKYLPAALVVLLALMVSVAVFIGKPAREEAKNRSLPFLTMREIDLGNKTYEEIEEVLEMRLGRLFENKVVVELNGEQKETSLSKLGVSVDLLKTVEGIYQYSYADNLYEYLKRRVRLLFAGVEVEPTVIVDEVAIEEELRFLFGDIGPSQDARVSIEDGVVEVLPDIVGLDVDFVLVVDELEQQLLNLQTPSLHISAETVKPEYTQAEAQIDLALSESLADTNMTLYRMADGDEVYHYEFRIPQNWFSIYKREILYSEPEIQNYLTQKVSPHVFLKSKSAIIKKLPMDEKRHALVDGVARDGLELDILETMRRIVAGFEASDFEIELAVSVTKGVIVNETEYELGDMTLLGLGRSDFKGSPVGRDFNIRKGLDEKFNNIILAPGEEFSYNSYLGPVTSGAGWKDSLAIFGGEELRPVPGGGLCQVSTTVYRAALRAGLEVTEKYNHSLYVHYYQKFGDGLDSTIYPGSKDLKFVNDTGHHILIQAYHEGTESIVAVYGVDDGRKVELTGPIYPGRVPEKLRNEIFPSRNQVVWKYALTRADGNVENKLLVSTYKTLTR